jgi:hypothetical protein
MNPSTIGVFIPIIGIVVGGAIAIIAIVSDHRQKIEMVKNGIEVPQKKHDAYPFKGIRFGALLIGVAFGLIVGGILENTGAFFDHEVGYFASVFFFGGLGLIFASLYINKKSEALKK